MEGESSTYSGHQHDIAIKFFYKQGCADGRATTPPSSPLRWGMDRGSISGSFVFFFFLLVVLTMLGIVTELFCPRGAFGENGEGGERGSQKRREEEKHRHLR